MMNKFLIACVTATGLCGFAHAATVQPAQQMPQPITVAADGGMSYMLGQLKGEIQMLQTEVHNLGNLEGQVPGGSRYVFAAGAEGSPVSVGG
jgi:hypothetical protein